MLNPERFLTVRFIFEWYPETSRSLYSYIRIREVRMFSRLYWYDQFIIFHLHPCPLRRNKNNKPNSSQIPHSNCTTSARITPVVLPAHWVRDGFGIPAEGGWQGVSLVSLGIAIASRSAAKTRQSKELNLCYAEIGCFTQWSDCVFAFRWLFVWVNMWYQVEWERNRARIRGCCGQQELYTKNVNKRWLIVAEEACRIGKVGKWYKVSKRHEVIICFFLVHVFYLEILIISLVRGFLPK